MSDADRRRYARFYYERFRAEYPDLYANSTTLGDFMKLLVESELAWPNHPEFPRSVRKSSITTFIERGLVEVAGYGFRLRGFAAERQRRTDKAKAAAEGRWGATGNALSNAPSIADGLPKTKKKDEEEEGERGARATNGRATYAPVDPVGAGR